MACRVRTFACGIVFMCIPAVAGATEFLSYTVTAVGSHFSYNGSLDTSTNVQGTTTAVFVLPYTPEMVSFSDLGKSIIPGGAESASVNGTTLSLITNGFFFPAVPSNISTGVCFDHVMTTLPTTAAGFIPGCGNLTATLAQHGVLNGYSGVIQSFSVGLDSLDVPGRGFVSLSFSPSVPEPSTWALMLIGLLSIAVGLRAKRTRQTPMQTAPQLRLPTAI